MTDYKRCILLKYGELILKGQNKRYFEERLRSSVRRRLDHVLGEGNYDLYSMQSTVFVTPADQDLVEDALEELKTVFGLAGLCAAWRCEKDMGDIKKVLTEKISPELYAYKSFKCEAKRSDKDFPLTSLEIMLEAGDTLCIATDDAVPVDVREPDVTVVIEIRDTHAYIHFDKLKGAGGMPVGTSGRGLLLLSGGIDSPVAGYMMARRGMEIEALHFESYPYTSERAKEKVLELARLMCRYTDKMRVNIISLTEIQLAIKENCKEEYFTLILRRFMMRLAAKVCRRRSLPAIITGESLGQVASQTIGALCSTDAIAQENHIPVFRPCIGQDKDEIVVTSRKIGTFDTSILPYEDCCTVFTPKHPKTNPDMEKILEEEAKLDIDLLCKNAFESLEYVNIKYYENT
ncbi:MAG: tRNA 4-thiouridine(8) synthase ThiI [Ruminococcaceae bacterium]|nr:tRNA 4-thiouridine(8) synthase ThiI [Oscillospiraceae bacterium]